jgi:hypothetical protein
MTLILAEISDKMPTILQIWVWSIVISLPALLGIVRIWLSWVIVILAFIFSVWLGYIACYEAFLEPGFAEAVQDEMGWWWITNYIASSFLPAVVAFTILLWHFKKKRTPVDS